MKRIIVSGAVAAAVGATTVPALSATSPTIKGFVGPGTAIGMSVKPKKAGTYTLVVKDTETAHNFRLTGPGVNVATSLPGKATAQKFKVKLKAGATYKFVCDPHASFMKGSFKVPK